MTLLKQAAGRPLRLWFSDGAASLLVLPFFRIGSQQVCEWLRYVMVGTISEALSRFLSKLCRFFR